MVLTSKASASCPPAVGSVNVSHVAETLVVNEIYLSLQGESTFAGLPCVFVRLTGCNLRCSYCDTAYAFTEGKRRSLDEVRAEVHRLAEPFSRPDRAHFPPVVNAGMLQLSTSCRWLS